MDLSLRKKKGGALTFVLEMRSANNNKSRTTPQTLSAQTFHKHRQAMEQGNQARTQEYCSDRYIHCGGFIIDAF